MPSFAASIPCGGRAFCGGAHDVPPSLSSEGAPCGTDAQEAFVAVVAPCAVRPVDQDESKMVSQVLNSDHGQHRLGLAGRLSPSLDRRGARAVRSWGRPAAGDEPGMSATIAAMKAKQSWKQSVQQKQDRTSQMMRQNDLKPPQR